MIYETDTNEEFSEFESGGGVGDELMGGQPNKSEKSGYKLLKVQHNGKIIVVTDNNGETKERWIKNENGVAGYSLRYNGNEYEFADSFNYVNGGVLSSDDKKNISEFSADDFQETSPETPSNGFP